MKKITLLVFILLIITSAKAQYTVSGGVAYNEDLGNTGIEKIYLLKTLSGATIIYTSTNPSLTFYSYRNSHADKKPILAPYLSKNTIGSTTTYTIYNLVGSSGYFPEENGKAKPAIWIVDYSMHKPILNGITAIESDDKCENLKLLIDKTDDLPFYTSNGAKRNVKRKYSITYEDEEWVKGEGKFVKKTNTAIKDEILGTEKPIIAPLRSTQFKLTGDQFAEQLIGAKLEITSAMYDACATEAYISAELEKPDGSREEVVTGSSDLSAPAKIHFKGNGNSTVYYYTWFIYKDDNTETPIARYTDQEMNYTFDNSGKYTVKLEVANQNSECATLSEIKFTISISSLKIPNYFSPNSTPGQNDEFRVYHKSLTKFKCTIFNRWGVKLYQWSDPDKGWDGKYKGKSVKPGVYFYVIEATGSDGKRWKKMGDINIL